MIGFVSVEIDMIKKAYGYINKDLEKTEDELKKGGTFFGRLKSMIAILETGTGNRHIYAAKEKLELKKILQEVAYASYASSTSTMFIRIEMASIILDIINIYENHDGAMH